MGALVLSLSSLVIALTFFPGPEYFGSLVEICGDRGCQLAAPDGARGPLVVECSVGAISESSRKSGIRLGRATVPRTVG